MTKKVKLIVELPHPNGVTMREIKDYVFKVVTKDPTTGCFVPGVKVYSPRRVVKIRKAPPVRKEVRDYEAHY